MVPNDFVKVTLVVLAGYIRFTAYPLMLPLALLLGTRLHGAALSSISMLSWGGIFHTGYYTPPQPTYVHLRLRAVDGWGQMWTAIGGVSLWLKKNPHWGFLKQTEILKHRGIMWPSIVREFATTLMVQDAQCTFPSQDMGPQRKERRKLCTHLPRRKLWTPVEDIGSCPQQNQTIENEQPYSIDGDNCTIAFLLTSISSVKQDTFRSKNTGPDDSFGWSGRLIRFHWFLTSLSGLFFCFQGYNYFCLAFKASVVKNIIWLHLAIQTKHRLNPERRKADLEFFFKKWEVFHPSCLSAGKMGKDREDAFAKVWWDKGGKKSASRQKKKKNIQAFEWGKKSIMTHLINVGCWKKWIHPLPHLSTTFV